MQEEGLRKIFIWKTPHPERGRTLDSLNVGVLEPLALVEVGRPFPSATVVGRPSRNTQGTWMTEKLQQIPMQCEDKVLKLNWVEKR